MSWCLSTPRPAGMITIEIICACEFHPIRKKDQKRLFHGVRRLRKHGRSSKRQPALQHFDDRQGEKAWKGGAPNGSQRFKILTIDRKGEQQYGDGVSLYFDELVPHGSNLLPGKVFPEGPKGSCHAILSNPAWVTHLLRTVVLNWYVEMHLTCKTTTTAAAATTTTKTKGRNTIKTIYIYIHHGRPWQYKTTAIKYTLQLRLFCAQGRNYIYICIYQ